MEGSDKKYSDAIILLQNKASELGRLPKREDFAPDIVCLIKQKLGPWPRALEKAGLKEQQKPSAKEKSREKRERIKQNRKKDGSRNEKY